MVLEVSRGRVWKFGDNINTDLLMPTFTTAGKMDDSEVHKYCMVAVRPEFAQQSKPGDVVVAGSNFGCGSSRPAQRNLLRLGITCVICESMAPIFYRNAINLGLPVLIRPGVSDLLEDGDEVEVNPRTGELVNIANGEEIQLDPLPDVLMDILEAGGLLGLLKRDVAEGKVV